MTPKEIRDKIGHALRDAAAVVVSQQSQKEKVEKDSKPKQAGAAPPKKAQKQLKSRATEPQRKRKVSSPPSPTIFEDKSSCRVEPLLELDFPSPMCVEDFSEIKPDLVPSMVFSPDFNQVDDMYVSFLAEISAMPSPLLQEATMGRKRRRVCSFFRPHVDEILQQEPCIVQDILSLNIQ